jgi:hypothetical protein
MDGKYEAYQWMTQLSPIPDIDARSTRLRRAKMKRLVEGIPAGKLDDSAARNAR